MHEASVSLSISSARRLNVASICGFHVCLCRYIYIRAHICLLAIPFIFNEVLM